MISKTSQTETIKNKSPITGVVSDKSATARQVARAREALHLALNRPYEPLSEALILAKDQALQELDQEAQALATHLALKKQRQAEIKAKADQEAQALAIHNQALRDMRLEALRAQIDRELESSGSDNLDKASLETLKGFEHE